MEPTAWPERGRSIIQLAIDSWSATFRNEEPLRIVWGAQDRDFEQKMKSEYGEGMARVDGLLNWGTIDCDLLLLPAEDSAVECDELRIRLAFGEPLILPTKAERLYGVLRRCENWGVMPSVWPHYEKENRISIMGIVVVLPLEAVTARVLRDTLERMDSAAEEVFLWVKKREGDDLFAEDSK